MTILAILTILANLLAETIGENYESKIIKKRGIYGEGFFTGIGLDSASIGSLNFESGFGNSGLAPGVNNGLQYGGAYNGYGTSGGGFGGSLSGLSGIGGGLISKHVTIQNNVAVPVPQPYAVPVTRTVAVPVPQTVRVPVDRPYPVRVPHPVPYPVDRPYPVTVEKPYPIPVPQPIPVKVFKPFPYPVSRPVPFPVVNTVPVPVPQPGSVGGSFPGSAASSPGNYGFSLGSGLTGGTSLGFSSSGIPVPPPPNGYGGLYGGRLSLGSPNGNFNQFF